MRVAAFITMSGVFASVAIGATASTSGVKMNPARKSTLSRVTSSCAKRLATAASLPPVSRLTISMVLPATVLPCSRM